MDTPASCTNNCGFFGSPANEGLCSKCYNDYLKTKISETEKSPVIQSKNDEQGVVLVDNVVTEMKELSLQVANEPVTDTIPVKKHRCTVCNKKVGLLGFACKCGGSYCGMHRYPELHSCNVDYKTAGRLMLEKQNPLCIGDKAGDRI